VPAGLQRFYQQTLTWTRCDDYASQDYQLRLYLSPQVECTRLTVPLDYDNAADSSPVLTLAVMRRPATDPAGRLGVIVATSGVDQSGLDFVSGNFYGNDDDRLMKSFDLVGFDQRGLGASGPRVTCLTATDRDVQRTTDTRTRTAAEVDAANAEAATFAAGCLAAAAPMPGVDPATYLSHIGTREAARDLDILRAAIVADQINLIGYSNGTRVARAYTEQFPDRVRSLLLDGVVGGGDPVAAELARARAAQAAFDAFAAWCAPIATCPLGSDPTQATSRYQQLVRPLLESPMAVADGRVLSYDDAVAGTFYGLASQVSWSPLSSALFALSKGHPRELMDLADALFGRAADGSYWPGIDTYQAVQCTDGPRPPTGAAANQLAADVASALPVLDNGDPPAATEDMCGSWPIEPTLPAPAASIPGLAPTLVISTVGDPITPYQSGADLAASLGAALLTVDGTRHTAFLQDVSCVNKAGTQFLITLQAPAPGGHCS
jgi:pimeloyl-ACP methyl ester carboxylesterase